jgi:SSS family solute:Na+ symporter
VAGVLVSILTAYVARSFNNVMDFLQLIFAFVNAPLFAAFLLGMFWKRTTGHAAFWGLISGTVSASIHHGLTLPAHAVAGIKGGYFGTLHNYPSEMAQNFWTAIFAFTAALLITLLVTAATRRTKSDEELKGHPCPENRRRFQNWFQKPGFMAIVVGHRLALSLLSGNY